MNPEITVLIADDHPLFRRGLRQAIEETPRFRIVGEASDGDEAIRMMTEAKPDILVLDIDMPRLNGLETARALQKSNSPVHIVFLTMYKDEGMFNAAMDLGVKGYVLKETAASEIITALDRAAAGQTFVSTSVTFMEQRRTSRSQELLLSKPQINDLTPSERRILTYIAEDRTSKEIAEILHISVRTVENHRLSICQKLNLHGTHSLLKFAFANKAHL